MPTRENCPPRRMPTKDGKERRSHQGGCPLRRDDHQGECPLGIDAHPKRCPPRWEGDEEDSNQGRIAHPEGRPLGRDAHLGCLLERDVQQEGCPPRRMLMGMGDAYWRQMPRGQLAHPCAWGLGTADSSPAAVRTPGLSTRRRAHAAPGSCGAVPAGIRGGFGWLRVTLAAPDCPHLLAQFIISGCLSIGAEKSPTECAVSGPEHPTPALPSGGGGWVLVVTISSIHGWIPAAPSHLWELSWKVITWTAQPEGEKIN